MRGGRSFLILLIVAVGLGTYIYFVESKRDLTEPAAKKDKVFQIDSGKFEEIEVHAPAGDVTHLKKIGDAWQIVEPEVMDADTTEVATLVSTLSSLEVQRTVDEHPASVQAFGLEPARFSVKFRLAGETAMRQLNVGAKTPTGSDLYARVEGQPKLVLIQAFAEDSLARTTFDFRDKTILKFDRVGTDMLKIEAADTPALAFARKGDAWRLTAPVDARADFSAVDGIVGQVFQAKMKSIVAPGAAGAAAAAEAAKSTSAGKKPAGAAESSTGTSAASGLSAADAKKYGFDKPQVTATVGVGSTRATLVIGGKSDDGSLYARDLARPVVFTVEAALLDGLKKKADDVRVKEIFEFRTYTVSAVDLTLGGKAFSFAKQKAAPDVKKDADKDKPKDAAAPATPATPAAMIEVWKQTKPAAAKDPDQTKWTDLLSSLSNLRAEKFADKALASGEDLVVVAHFGDETAPKEERVTFRKSGDVVHVIRQGEPGAAVVSTSDYDKAISQFKELAGIK
jgi:hypothetical protein